MTLVPPQTFRKTAGIHRIGLAANKPAATDVLAGTLYFSTDTFTLERSNGTAWESYSGTGSNVALLNADQEFTGVNTFQQHVEFLNDLFLEHEGSLSKAILTNTTSDNGVTISSSVKDNGTVGLGELVSFGEKGITRFRQGPIHPYPVTLAQLNTIIANSTFYPNFIGIIANIYDSVSDNYGDVVVGGSSKNVLARYDGTNWIVIGTKPIGPTTPLAHHTTHEPGGSDRIVSLALGASPATTGTLRLSSADTITARNASTSSDAQLLSLDSAGVARVAKDAPVVQMINDQILFSGAGASAPRMQLIGTPGKYLQISHDGSNAQISTVGSFGILALNTEARILLTPGHIAGWAFDTGGQLYPQVDAAYDLGLTGARLQNAYFAGTINVPQIQFPAAQVASSNANVLDDYEEGVWTPTDASGAGLTLTASGSYIKVGQLVTAAFLITYPSTANASNIAIGGLPFVSINGSDIWAGLFGFTQVNVAHTILVIHNSATGQIFTNAGSTVPNSVYSGRTVTGTFVYRAAA